MADEIKAGLSGREQINGTLSEEKGIDGTLSANVSLSGEITMSRTLIGGWNELTGKPFKTLGEDFKVVDDALELAQEIPDISGKADKATTYTKTETDNKVGEVKSEVDYIYDNGFASLNLWDEKYIYGGIDNSTGAVTDGINLINKNYISVNANTKYYIKINNPSHYAVSPQAHIYYYKADATYISKVALNGADNVEFTTPDECGKILFRIGGDGVVSRPSYDHDITISKNGVNNYSAYAKNNVELTNEIENIATPNDAILTIKQNGVVKGIFTANSDKDVEVNLTGGGGSGVGSWADLSGKPFSTLSDNFRVHSNQLYLSDDIRNSIKAINDLDKSKFVSSLKVMQTYYTSDLSPIVQYAGETNDTYTNGHFYKHDDSNLKRLFKFEDYYIETPNNVLDSSVKYSDMILWTYESGNIRHGYDGNCINTILWTYDPTTRKEGALKVSFTIDGKLYIKQRSDETKDEYAGTITWEEIPVQDAYTKEEIDAKIGDVETLLGTL